jgi:hypothetical protein
MPSSLASTPFWRRFSKQRVDGRDFRTFNFGDDDVT